MAEHEPDSVSAKLQGAASSFIATATSAAQLIAKQTEKTKIHTISLPYAFNALGKTIFIANKFREELKDAYATLDGHLAVVKQLKAQAATQPKAENITDKAKAAARAAADMAQVKVL